MSTRRPTYPSFLQWLRQRPVPLRTEMWIAGGFTFAALVWSVLTDFGSAWPAVLFPAGMTATRFGFGYVFNRQPLPRT